MSQRKIELNYNVRHVSEADRSQTEHLRNIETVNDKFVSSQEKTR